MKLGITDILQVLLSEQVGNRLHVGGQMSTKDLALSPPWFPELR